MKEFFKLIANSIWNPTFYAVMGSKTKREGIHYFVSLMFFTSFLIMVVFAVFAVPAGFFGARTAYDLIKDKYPADLVITFKNGVASTTVARAYTLPLLPEILSEKDISKLNKAGFDSFLIVDTRNNFGGTEQFAQARTMAYLAKDSFVAYKNSGFEVTSLKDVPNFTLTKSFILDTTGKIISLIKYTLPIWLVLFFLVLFVIGGVMYIVFAAISAALIWALGSIARRKMPYSEAFVTSLYAVTLPVLIDFLFLVGGRPNGMSFLMTISLSVLVWAINVKIWEKPNLPSTVVNEPPAKI